ncbi:hypothetical protein PHK61_30510 [Actinomycetospora lutea]|uniref:hypothetical protein n=1 Tax=Actinomycetospora lutea TaxID=663604 RepID=UPI0023672473|nr:hypothetical protein [Actinomycetospora lutea]MDD7942755.1 hypothetical protein [Actinomycetospora lutea]
MVASGRVVVGLLLAVLALAGCSSEYTEGTSAPAARPDGSLEAARTKLRLVQQDPCYTVADLTRQWPVCARWEEEVLNVGNAAAGARPDDREITDPALAVRTGHEHFVRGGCATGATPADTPRCIGAIEETRTAVTRLAQGMSAAR